MQSPTRMCPKSESWLVKLTIPTAWLLNGGRSSALACGIASENYVRVDELPLGRPGRSRIPRVHSVAHRTCSSVFVWRRHRESFSAVRHAAIPLLGALTLIIPFVERVAHR